MIKEEFKEKMFLIGLVGLLVIALFVSNKLNDNFMEDCLAAGNSQTTCERAL